MANITASEINKLRQHTGAGMMDCRKALMENDGDFDKAVDSLRKKGQKVAELRGGRDAKEGVVLAEAEGTRATIIKISCETDFVAKNEDFLKFAKKIADIAQKSSATDTDTLKKEKYDSVSVGDKLNEQVGKIGEKIDIAEFAVLSGQGLVSYVHANYRLAVVVAFNKALSTVQVESAKDIAMQIAAMNPLAIDEKSISPDTIAREKNIILEQMQADPKMAGKPQQMLDKIVEGKLGAFFKEKCLLAQNFIKDDSKSVGAYLKTIDPALAITDFKRFSL